MVTLFKALYSKVITMLTILTDTKTELTLVMSEYSCTESVQILESICIPLPKRLHLYFNLFLKGIVFKL